MDNFKSSITLKQGQEKDRSPEDLSERILEAQMVRRIFEDARNERERDPAVTKTKARWTFEETEGDGGASGKMRHDRKGAK